MNVGFHYRSVDAEFLAILQTELHGRLDYGLIDGCQRGWREPVEGPVKGVVLGDKFGVKLRKAAQRVAVVDALAQFAIVPVLDTHESQRAQRLRGSDAVAPGAGILQAALQIQADLLDQIGVLAEECVNALQDRVEMDAQSAQFQIGEAQLRVESSAHWATQGLAVAVRPEDLVGEFADALQGGLEFLVVAQPLLDERLLLCREADLLVASAGIADGQYPDEMALTASTGGAAGAMANAAAEQGAAEDLGGGE